VTNVVEEFKNNFTAANKPQIIMICLPRVRDQAYNEIKTTFSTRFPIPVQCVKVDTLFKKFWISALEKVCL
jgi:hypothetical protein